MDCPLHAWLNLGQEARHQRWKRDTYGPAVETVVEVSDSNLRQNVIGAGRHAGRVLCKVRRGCLSQGQGRSGLPGGGARGTRVAGTWGK